MNKIKIVSLGGLNENGKNTYVIEIDEKIFIFGHRKPDTDSVCSAISLSYLKNIYI